MSTSGPQPREAVPEAGSATRAAGPDAAPRRPRNVELRYRAFRRGLQANPVLDLTWRIGVLSLGVVVLAAGIAMLALPGPGWATIFIGLLILASEFTWARRSLDWARVRAKQAKQQALAPEVRRRNQVIAVAVALVVVVGVVVYWQVFGFPGPVVQWVIDTIGR